MHLYFACGYGIHFCIGAPVARMEGEIAINSMRRRFPAMQLTDSKVVWRCASARKRRVKSKDSLCVM